MLQQTQVSAVINYYQRFMTRFPDVATLATTPIDEVMPYWAGLGYYARARNLHKAACVISNEFGGVFPTDFDAIHSLPGIGRSTAAAISAFAYGQPRPILDGNVKRVFARYFGISGDIRAKAIEDTMWKIAEREMPLREVEAYIQGQMDLGATLCARGKPKCLLCPLKDSCFAQLQGLTDSLPQRATKKIIPHRETQMLVLLHQNKVYLERRPPTGIWGGLNCLPEMNMDGDVIKTLRDKFGGDLQIENALHPLAPIEHGFTHYSLTIYPLKITIPAITKPPLTVNEQGAMWIDLDTLNASTNNQNQRAAALPAPVKKILLALLKN